MLRPNRMMLEIDGLWSPKFGNRAAGGSTNALLLTGGPNGKSDGLFASITTP